MLWVKALRQRQGLSQKQLAKLAKVHQVCISRVERGTVWPTTYTLQKIADGLRLPICALIRPTDPALAGCPLAWLAAAWDAQACPADFRGSSPDALRRKERQERTARRAEAGPPVLSPLKP